MESLDRWLMEAQKKIIPGSPQQTEANLASLGRNEEERAQIREMCEENRRYRQRLKDLREARAKGMSRDQWLEQTIERELKEVYPEISEQEIEGVKDFVQQRFHAEIEANVEALNSMMSLQGQKVGSKQSQVETQKEITRQKQCEGR